MIRTNIRGGKYSNIFEYPNIRHTMILSPMSLLSTKPPQVTHVTHFTLVTLVTHVTYDTPVSLVSSSQQMFN